MTRHCAASLIIATYERRGVLELVLASLERQSYRDFEVVIADDGSGAEIAELTHDWGDRTGRRVVHVRHDDDGFRKTIIVNRAVAESSGDYLVFIDADCLLHHRFIERHMYRRKPGQALSGRRVMLDAELSGRLTVDDIRTARFESPSFWWQHAKAHDRRNGLYAPALYGWRGGWSREYAILGSNFSLHRNTFLLVNGYDEAIVGRGMEDVNLRTRLLNAGVGVHSISQEALQYHCHHDAEPMPHDAGSTERWRTTSESWTPRGVIKGQQ